MMDNNVKKQRLFIIGRLKDERGHIEAYKVYLDNTKEISIVSKNRLFELAKKSNPNELVIVGLRRKGEKLDKNGLPTIIENVYLYPTGELDIVDGFGEPVEAKGKKIVVDVEGYQRAAKYRLIDSMGNEEKVGYKQFKELLEANKIVGAKLHNEVIRVYKHCDTRN